MFSNRLSSFFRSPSDPTTSPLLLTNLFTARYFFTVRTMAQNHWDHPTLLDSQAINHLIYLHQITNIHINVTQKKKKRIYTRLKNN